MLHFRREFAPLLTLNRRRYLYQVWYTDEINPISSKTLTIAGSVHRFGKSGVLYAVLQKLDETSALIRVIETGEETAYPIADILRDPTE